MGLSIMTYGLILFTVFMNTFKGVTDKAKKISLAISVIWGIFCIVKVIWG